MTEGNRPVDRGPAEESNGGPVTPGATQPVGVPHESNGALVPAGRGPGGVAGTGPDGVADREASRPSGPEKLARSRASGVWVGLTVSAVVLLFLLIFIVQNNTPTEIKFLGLTGHWPVGIALLFAAAAGILLVAIPGYLRILQLRRAFRRRGSH
ncbi:MAG TPA: lipopolysaccharide assembly protein LapA domain-containing protein [Pseudonocardia sp.]